MSIHPSTMASPGNKEVGAVTVQRGFLFLTPALVTLYWAGQFPSLSPSYRQDRRAESNALTQTSERRPREPGETAWGRDHRRTSLGTQESRTEGSIAGDRALRPAARASGDDDARHGYAGALADHRDLPPRLGDATVILGWVVLTLTNSETMVGAVFAVRSAPNLVVGFAAGTLTDRYDRRSLMRLAAFGMAGVSFVVAWLASTEQLTVWSLLLCSGALGMWQALEMTARQAYVVDTLGVHRAAQGIA